MSHEAGWFESHTADAPVALRARMRELAAARWSADGLAQAAVDGLAAVAAHPGDRRVALDLLSVDGLITLALLRRAEEAPTELAAFGAQLTLEAGR